VIACGRRFGKTILGEYLLSKTILAAKPCGWFAPTYKYLTDVWRDVVRIHKPIISNLSVQERRIELITGGVAEFWSLEDKDAGRGRKYARAIIDEAAKVKDLGEIFNESIRPTLTDHRGDAYFLSTPKGMNFFWQCFARGNDPNEGEWAAWHKPTAANPYIDGAEIEAYRLGAPDRAFRQEMLAEFIEDAGGVFRKVREAIDRGRVENDAPRGGNYYSIGVDLARVEDFTVICVLDGAGRQIYHERFNLISWERQIDAITRVAKRYPGRVIIDSTGVGDPICEALRNSSVDLIAYQFTNQTKQTAIDRLALALETGRLRLMDLACQTNELLAFEYELTPSRNVRMSAPEGMHDDCVIALSLAAWGMERYAFVAPTEAEIQAQEQQEKEAKARERAEAYALDNPHWWGADD
jgi:Terminase large subunit, T4likevirus-type, N-terminal